VADAGEFYDAELESAGFEVTFRYAEGDEYSVRFTDQAGRPGQISITSREFQPVVMDIGLEG
jgi:hypothetical protein